MHLHLGFDATGNSKLLRLTTTVTALFSVYSVKEGNRWYLLSVLNSIVIMSRLIMVSYARAWCMQLCFPMFVIGPSVRSTDAAWLASM